MAPAMGNELQHRTVLLEEAVEALVKRPDGVYVDGTFGRGGHSRAVLGKLGESGRLIAFDKDPLAIATAQKIEHYEIASYGSARDWAIQLGLSNHAATLEKTLAEEKHADHLLSEISQRANAVAATV